MQKYVPRAPSVTLEEAVQQLPRRVRLHGPRAAPVPRSGRPSPHSLPGLHDNLFARLLAAKPKMDTVTRQVFPSTLLTKVGLVSESEIGARSPARIFRGPRLWVSAFMPTLPKAVVGRLLSRHPHLAGLGVQQHFAEKARSVLLSDIKELTAAYKARPPPPNRRAVCIFEAASAEAGSAVPSVPLIDLAGMPELQEIGLPAEIRSSPAGLHLAGFLFKYTYLYGPASA